MSSPRDKSPLENYARYTSMGIQMLVIIFLGVFGGYKLDQLAGTTPLLTLLLSFAGVTMAIYLAIKDFLKKNKKQNPG